MSPRTDSYLSLCLEQAIKSPLHYRHGCIIVRGGKVIGQGYNDHRPHFDGGAKRLAPFSAFNSPAVAALDQKNKCRSKAVSEKSKLSKQNESSSETHMPCGDTKGGNLANTPLSMHSEMMAIHSALSFSSTLASQASTRSAQWLQKPSLKLPGRAKRGLRLQNIKAYINRAADKDVVTQERKPAANQRSGKSQVQASQFETCSSRCGRGEGGEVGPHQGVRVRGVQQEEEEMSAPEEQCFERPYEGAAWASSRSSTLSSGSTTWTDCGTWTTAAAWIDVWINNESKFSQWFCFLQRNR